MAEHFHIGADVLGALAIALTRDCALNLARLKKRCGGAIFCTFLDRSMYSLRSFFTLLSVLFVFLTLHRLYS